MSAVTLLAGALVVVGLIGVVVPVVPGSPLVAAGVLVWALGIRTGAGWVVLAVALVLLAAGQVLSWVLAGRTVTAAGVPRRSLVVAAVGAVVGVFVIPVVGLPVGGILGLYLAELVRLGPGAPSARSTWTALRALAVAVGVELAACVAATGVWVVGLVVA